MSDKYTVPNKLPAKEVSILAHRKRRIEHDHSLHRLKSKKLREAIHRKKINFHKAEYFVNQYLLTERDERRIKRRVVTKGLAVKSQKGEKIFLVYRHRAKKVASETVTSALKSLGVSKIYKASLVPITLENRALLGIVEPYIAYGYPTVQTIRDLIFKHGFVFKDGKKVPITSNTDVEEHLGSYGIICIEDMIHELFTVGTNFDVVRRFLGSFKLQPPIGGFKKKRGKNTDQGGEYGNKKYAINKFVESCL